MAKGRDGRAHEYQRQIPVLVALRQKRTVLLLEAQQGRQCPHLDGRCPDHKVDLAKIGIAGLGAVNDGTPDIRVPS